MLAFYQKRKGVCQKGMPTALAVHRTFEGGTHLRLVPPHLIFTLTPPESLHNWDYCTLPNWAPCLRLPTPIAYCPEESTVRTELRGLSETAIWCCFSASNSLGFALPCLLGCPSTPGLAAVAPFHSLAHLLLLVPAPLSPPLAPTPALPKFRPHHSSAVSLYTCLPSWGLVFVLSFCSERPRYTGAWW